MARSISLPTLTFLIFSAMRAEAVAHGVPVTVDEVEAAIQETGVDVSPVQVVMLSTVVAKSNVPSLKVQSVGPRSAHQDIVRLTCSTSDECLPFYVAVNHLDDTVEAKSTPAAGLQSNSISSKPMQAPIAIKSGSHARLLIDSGRIHIQISVTTLTAGAVGDIVKAQNADHKTYWAKVVDGETLRGQL